MSGRLWRWYALLRGGLIDNGLAEDAKDLEGDEVVKSHFAQ